MSEKPATDDSTSSHRRGSRLRRVLLGVLVVALVVALGVCGWLLSDRTRVLPTVTGEAQEKQVARDAIMSRADQFMLRMGTFGPDLLNDEDRMPKYRERVTEVITSEFASSFKEQAGTAEGLVAQAGLSRDAEVFGTGVASMDEDSATALVAGSFTDSYKIEGKRQSQPPAPFRMELAMVKVDGEWLVDNFEAVTGGGESSPQPGGGSSPTAPGGGTPAPSPSPGTGNQSPSGEATP